jgi:choline kinase
LHIQQSAHGIGDDETSDKHQRRQLRKARKERLYPNVVDEKRDKKKYTKVIRTTGENQEHWMELDMGECLMEIASPHANKKILCAFSSLEIILKDEDASDSEGAN